MKQNILLDHIRPVTEKDKDLIKFSHSKLECFENCPMQYEFKYRQKLSTQDTTLALELGGLCHKILELKGLMLNQGKLNYEYLSDSLLKGHMDDGKMLEGINKLKEKYWEEWYTGDNASGMNYDEKLKVFNQVLHEEMENDDWTPLCFERHFEFVWDEKYIIHGFIDRIDSRTNDDGEIEYRIVDYKTSKKPFDPKKNVTSQQFAIYQMGMLIMFGQLAKECQYRFILIDEEQSALTLGWEKRIIKKLDKVFAKIEENEKTPKATPLCYYCNYSHTNPKAKDFKELCEYYSLWTPSSKTFKRNKDWNAEENLNNKTTNRKLIF